MNTNIVLKMTEDGDWVSVCEGTYSEERKPQLKHLPMPAGQVGGYDSVYAHGDGASILAGAQSIPEEDMEQYPRVTPSELDGSQEHSWCLVTAPEAAESAQSTATGPTFLSIVEELDRLSFRTEQGPASRKLTAAALASLPAESAGPGGAIRDWIPTRIGDRYAALSTVDEQYGTRTRASGEGGFAWAALAIRDIGRDTQGFGSIFSPPANTGTVPYSKVLEVHEQVSEWSVRDYAV